MEREDRELGSEGDCVYMSITGRKREKKRRDIDSGREKERERGI